MRVSFGIGLWAVMSVHAFAAEPAVRVDRPMSPPAWALLQRALLKANADACREFYHKYFDERGFLLCVERWGGDDGPDDAIENCTDWPILHALGGDDSILKLYKKAWEGHLRQFTLAKTTHVPFAKDGMYYKEFPVMFDWLHNTEGLTVFGFQGLSDPYDAPYRARLRRYAGFYMDEDPGAPNYDPKLKLIKSMINGSRGPMLRKATGLDWAGDPIDVAHRFDLRHGEQSYEEMVYHFKDYNDVAGDHPQNLQATQLAIQAYMLEHEPKYKKWLLEYVDAWCERAKQNGGIIPSNIGLDGKLGGEANGRWYGGVYGWGFSPVMPNGRTVHRNNIYLAFAGFANAFVLTGDDKYLDVWRKQLHLVNSHKKMVNGRWLYPHNYGELSNDPEMPKGTKEVGWYNFTPQKFNHAVLDLYCLSMKPEDRANVEGNGWLAFLEGKNASFPEDALRRDLDRVRTRVQGMRADKTTPDTRLADDPLRFNPASVESLVQQMVGGVPTGIRKLILHARLRYFDPAKRRAGLPADVAALIEKMTDDSVTLTLVNTNPLAERRVVIQGGTYGEHQLAEVSANGKATSLNSSSFAVTLGPGCGGQLTLKMKRHANQPRLGFPPL